MFRNLMHATELTIPTHYPRFAILNNYIQLLSFRNKLTEYHRGVGRRIVQLRNGEFRILLAIPPRHACFGMHPSQLNIPQCIDAFPANVYDNRLERGFYGDRTRNMSFGFYWWIFEFTLTQPDYLRLAEMFDILISHRDISTLKSKPIFSWRAALDDLESYINLIREKHEELTGSTYTERPTSSHRNARHRKKNKRRLQAVGISIVR